MTAHTSERRRPLARRRPWSWKSTGASTGRLPVSEPQVGSGSYSWPRAPRPCCDVDRPPTRPAPDPGADERSLRCTRHIACSAGSTRPTSNAKQLRGRWRPKHETPLDPPSRDPARAGAAVSSIKFTKPGTYLPSASPPISALRALPREPPKHRDRGSDSQRTSRWFACASRHRSGRRRGLFRGSDPVGDRGCFTSVRCVEFAQDVRNVDAGCLDADDEVRRDLAVRVATGDEGQDLRLARCQAESLLQASPSVGLLVLRGGEIEPRALGEQLELPQQRIRSDASGDGVC